MTLVLDVAGASVNTLSRKVMRELIEILTGLEQRSLTGLIIRSAKPAGFIAGADVHEFEHITDAATATRLARIRSPCRSRC